MKRIIIAAALVTVALTWAASAAPSSPTMTLAISPNPPKVGADEVIIRLTDARNRAVEGARITVATSMPSMSMGGPSAVARPQGNGRYVAEVKLAYATLWRIAVTAHFGEDVVRRSLDVSVRH